MPHIILLPFGSGGDVFRFIWLGRHLGKRGHRGTMITPCLFEEHARAAVDRVGPVAAHDEVSSGIAIDRVIAEVPEDRIGAVTSGELVIVGSAIDVVSAGVSQDGVDTEATVPSRTLYGAAVAATDMASEKAMSDRRVTLRTVAAHFCAARAEQI